MARLVSEVRVERPTPDQVSGPPGGSIQQSHLRKHFALPSGRFSTILIGEDGHVAVYSGKPVGSADLTRTIDAMPMRRAGQR